MYQELTVEGTRRLLKALGQFQVEQFVFSSSLLVMEPAEGDEVIMESSPTKGSWDYPVRSWRQRESSRKNGEAFQQ
jgi:nucleoside-diphosphate-sugar epimerase